MGIIDLWHLRRNISKMLGLGVLGLRGRVRRLRGDLSRGAKPEFRVEKEGILLRYILNIQKNKYPPNTQAIPTKHSKIQTTKQNL